MKTRSDIRRQLPVQCRDCPVVKRFDILLGWSEFYSDDYTKRALKDLDKAQTEDIGFIREIYREQGVWSGESALNHAERQIQIERQLDLVIGQMGDECPGSVRGKSETSGFYRVMDYITNERSCRNPNFAKLLGHEAISLQLRLGNWEQPERELS